MKNIETANILSRNELKIIIYQFGSNILTIIGRIINPVHSKMNPPQQEIPELEDLLSNPTLTLEELLTESRYKVIAPKIKNSMHKFIEYLQENQGLLQQIIDLGVKTDVFETTYNKKLSNFCVDILSGDFGQVAELFIREHNNPEENKQTQTQMDIEGREVEESLEKLDKYPFLNKFQILLYLFQYVRRPKQEISPICINYFTKLLVQLIQNRPYDFYLFLYSEEGLLQELYGASQSQVQGQMQEQQPISSTLDILISMAYDYPSVSEMLGKMIAEEGLTNKFKLIKERVVQGILKNLLCEKKIEANTENYQFLLDFVSYIFMRNKYRSEQGVEQISLVSQRFVEEDVLWFFKEKLIKSVIDVTSHSANSSNSVYSHESISAPNKIKYQKSQEDHHMLCSTNLTTNIDKIDDPLGYSHQISPSNQARKIHHKYSFSEQEIEEVCQERQFQDLIFSSEIVFHNSLAFLILLAQRMNVDEEVDPYLSLHNSSYKPEPTMNFHVNEALFSENSLFELMTLTIPSKFSNLERMKFYQFILQLTRNSRYRVAEEEDLMEDKQIRINTLVSILIHFLQKIHYLQKSFKKEFKPRKYLFNKKKTQKGASVHFSKNNMIKFYIQQIITEAILPKIDKLEPKEAMMVISALGPSQEMFKDELYEEDRAYIFKLLLMLENKCHWFSAHFKSIAVDMVKIKLNFMTVICGESMATKDRKFTIKQFSFLKEQKSPSSCKDNKEKKDRSMSGEWSSSSNSEQNQFDVKREFEFPEDEEEPVSVIQWENLEEQKKLQQWKDKPVEPQQ